MTVNKDLKYDNGKNRLGLVLGGFAPAIKEVGCIGTFGATKYEPNSWQVLDNGVARYTDALFRHLIQWQSGEEFDSESGYRHLAHAAWNCLAILTLTHKPIYLKSNKSVINPIAKAYSDLVNAISKVQHSNPNNN